MYISSNFFSDFQTLILKYLPAKITQPLFTLKSEEASVIGSFLERLHYKNYRLYQLL